MEKDSNYRDEVCVCVRSHISFQNSHKTRCVDTCLPFSVQVNLIHFISVEFFVVVVVDAQQLLRMRALRLRHSSDFEYFAFMYLNSVLNHNFEEKEEEEGNESRLSVAALFIARQPNERTSHLSFAVAEFSVKNYVDDELCFVVFYKCCGCVQQCVCVCESQYINIWHSNRILRFDSVVIVCSLSLVRIRRRLEPFLDVFFFSCAMLLLHV